MRKSLSKIIFPEYTTQELCDFLSKKEIEFECIGKPNTFIGVAQVDKAQKNHLAWSKRLDERALASPATVLILPYGSELEKLDKTDRTYILVKDPRNTFRVVLLGLFGKQCDAAKGLDDAKFFAKSTNSTQIAVNAVISDNAQIGKNVIIHPGVTIYPGVEIGNNVEICPNCVIGAPGFGHVKEADGKMYPFPHLGGVRIGDNVSIGSNTCIDSGGLSPTLIGHGTKIGNITQIAHNVEIEEDCLIGTRVQIAGSTKIGTGTEIWSGSTVANNRKIGRNCNVKAGSIVINHLPDHSVVSGNFAIPHENSLKEFNRLRESG